MHNTEPPSQCAVNAVCRYDDDNDRW